MNTDETRYLINHGRRNAIRKITAGVGALTAISVLPEQWTRPIIEQIVLPAHAAPSGILLTDPCELTLMAGDQASASVTVSVRAYITPAVAGLAAQVTATASGGANLSVQASGQTNAQGAFEATVTLGGGPGITAVEIRSSINGASGMARCSLSVPASGTTTTTTAAPGTTATTTTTTTTAAPVSCDAVAGTYIANSDTSLSWPGGTGPHQLGVTNVPGLCWITGNPTGVFASSAAEAAGILGSSVIQIALEPPPPSGCNFYVDAWTVQCFVD